MVLKMDDRVEYASDTIDEKHPWVKIVDINKNSKDFITSYFRKLYVGLLAQFQPSSLNWRKLEGSTHAYTGLEGV